MTNATPRTVARHTHLIRAARSAGEVFAYSSADPEVRRRGSAMIALWLGAGGLAALGLYLAL